MKTADNMKKMSCPFYAAAVMQMNMAVVLACDEGPTGKPAEGMRKLSTCLADGCPMWRCDDPTMTAEHHKKPETAHIEKSKKGYCGLAGKP